MQSYQYIINGHNLENFYGRHNDNSNCFLLVTNTSYLFFMREKSDSIWLITAIEKGKRPGI